MLRRSSEEMPSLLSGCPYANALHLTKDSLEVAISRMPVSEPHQVTFSRGDQVEYWCKSLSSWIPATILLVDHDTHSVQAAYELVDEKKEVWISDEQKASWLRPRSCPGQEQIEWARLVLLEGRLNTEADALFAKFATPTKRGIDVVAGLLEDKLSKLAEALDAKLGIAGSILRLLRLLSSRRATSGSASKDRIYPITAETFREMFWQIVWEVQNGFCQESALPPEAVAKRASRDPREAYTMIADLGTGTFGVVQLLKHNISGALRAVKTIQRHVQPFQSRVLAWEVEHLTRLDHPHIVRLHEHFEEDSYVFMVMDYCSGGELQDCINEAVRTNTFLEEPWIASVMQQVLMAIAHVHARGLVHLDLKSTNIMLQPGRDTVPPGSSLDQFAQGQTLQLVRERPHAMIIDLGVAQIFNPDNFKKRQPCGTPQTMAPEVWYGELTPKADVFSLGAVLYHMTTLFMPFQVPDKADGAKRWWSRRPTQNLSLLEHASPGLKSLCGSMLSQDRQVRPTAAECLQQDFLKKAGAGSRLGCDPTPNFGASSEQKEDKIDPRDFEVPPRLVEILANAHNRSVLHKSVALEIARDWPSNRMPTMIRIFQALDKEVTGRLPRERMSALLKAFGTEAWQADLAADAMDSSRDGRIDWSDFVAACVDLSDERFSESVKQTFKNGDLDGDGLLSQDDLCRITHVDKDKVFVVKDLFVHLVGRRESGARMDWTTFHRHLCKECPAANSNFPSWLAKAEPNSFQVALDEFVAQAGSIFESAANLWTQWQQDIIGAQPDEDQIQAALKQLHEMGFTDRQRCLKVLHQHRYKVTDLVTDELLR